MRPFTVAKAARLMAVLNLWAAALSLAPSPGVRRLAAWAVQGRTLESTTRAAGGSETHP